MANRIAGTAYFSINGKRYSLVGSFRYRCSGEQREVKDGADGFHGIKVKYLHGMIAATLRNDGSVPLNELNDFVDETMVCELANGKTVIGRNMARTGEPVTADAEEAEVEITFEGPDVRD